LSDVNSERLSVHFIVDLTNYTFSIKFTVYATFENALIVASLGETDALLITYTAAVSNIRHNFCATFGNASNCSKFRTN
jgi:hypothetical protein